MSPERVMLDSVYALGVPRAVGINHVALEVGDLDEAVAFWQRIFGPLELRGRVPGMAFLDLGDQFVALAEGRSGAADAGRHFGLVVDDKEAVRERVRAEGLDAAGAGGRLRFRDPWGNNIEVVDYGEVQFTKAPHVARAIGLDETKSERALRELREKGIDPPGS
jgi:catechol 2,3-dioxygenase-like lactoylglutathione lyase family enzyme